MARDSQNIEGELEEEIESREGEREHIDLSCREMGGASVMDLVENKCPNSAREVIYSRQGSASNDQPVLNLSPATKVKAFEVF